MKEMNVALVNWINDVKDGISVDCVRKNTNFNCLPIVAEANALDNVWQAAIQYDNKKDMIPMVELHKVTSNTFEFINC